ncbi:DUF1592 domain-containing protein [Roseimaritima sediminicola]|uniref:DUF1592 domain-containing protein n=1 Tax=Roseimaritima sediminicola TaxID=2662066 RepID=UPI0012983D05|nr:DUF1592 domain-containing protein [Roseimaritima sediminicola]
MRLRAVICLVTLAASCLLSADSPLLPGGKSLLAADAAKPSPTPHSTPAEDWAESGADLIRSHCLDCHNEDYQEAEVDLSQFASVEGIAANQGLWKRVLEMVQFGAMPPEDAEPLSDDQRAGLVQSLDRVLYSAACDLDPRPGKVTVRRLNRAEYDNTISDLFGVPLSVSDSFPSDEVGAGFDNNGDVLSIPPMLFEKYMAAAEQVSRQVIFDPRNIERKDIEHSGDQILTLGDAWVGSFYGHFLAADTIAWTEMQVPYTGHYRLHIRGGATEKDQTVRVGVFDAEGVLLDSCELKHYGSSGGSAHSSVKVTLNKGRTRLLFGLLEQDAEAQPGKTVLAGVERLTEEEIAAGRAAVGKSIKVDRKAAEQDVAYMLRKVTLNGPEGTPEGLIPASHPRILTHYPAKDRSVREAAKLCLQPLLRRAFRGPVDDQTVDAYARLTEQMHKREKSFERAMQVTVSAILVSPRFLFRVELPPENDTLEPGAVRPLTDHQLASRLSYFLWSSMPDEELLRLADEGKLSDEAVLREQVARMLKDERAEALGENFAAQWLGLRNLDQFEPDPTQFPDFDDSLREAMRQETLLLFRDVVRENRSVLTLLDSAQTYVNERLAAHYGIDGVEGDEFRLVSVQEAGRSGILTHASVLTLTSNPGRTSPVKRGKWIMETLMGTRPPDPPAGVPELEETATSNPDASLRVQLEAHRADPACASCHRVMDQLGFGLENFGPLGGYRSEERGQPIDATGVLPGGRNFDGALPLIEQLRKTESEAFVNTMADRLLTFAIGRELTPVDRCFLTDIVAESAESEHRFVALATAVALSKPFRFHTLEEK